MSKTSAFSLHRNMKPTLDAFSISAAYNVYRACTYYMSSGVTPQPGGGSVVHDARSLLEAGSVDSVLAELKVTTNAKKTPLYSIFFYCDAKYQTFDAVVLMYRLYICIYRLYKHRLFH